MTLEGTDHVLECFRLDYKTPEAPRRFFNFKIFDDESSLAQQRNPQGRREPRSIVSADVDGDGLADLVALTHDNILFYRQIQPKDKK